MKSRPSQPGSEYQESDMLKLVHELEVRKVELEIQNEELMQAKIDSREALEKFSELYYFAPTGYLTMSKEGQIDDLNLAGQHILGAGKSQLTRKPFNFFVSIDTRPIFVLFLANVFNGSRNETCELTISTPGNLPVYVHLSGVLSQNGAVCMVTMTDITSHKHLENSLVESESRYKSLFQGNHSVMLIIDPDTGEIRDANPAACRYYGWSHEEICRKLITDINTLSDTEVDTEMQQAIREKRNHFLFQHRLASGDIRDVEVFSGPIKFGNNTLLYSLVHDITDRKQAEKAVKENEEKYRHMFSFNPQPMWIYDLNTLAFLEVNDAAITHYGYSRDEFLAMTLKDIRPAEDIPALLKDVEKTTLTYNPAGTWRHLKKNGEMIFVEITSQSISFNGREARHVMISDITERKVAEELLKQSSQKWHALISASPDGIGLVTLDGKLKYMSDKLAEMYGYSVAEAQRYLGVPVLDFIDPSCHPTLLSNIGRLISGEINYQITEYLCIKRDGTRFYVELYSALLLDSNGNPESILYIERDISQRKQAESTIRESEALYRAILNASPDDITITDLEGHIQIASPSALKMFGYDNMEELRKISIQDYIDPADLPRAQVVIEQMHAGVFAGSGEYRGIRKDGSVFDIEANGEFIRNDKGEPVSMVFIVRDISERKHAEILLANKTAILSNLIINMQEGILLENANREIALTNQLFCDMFGIPAPPEALVGADCSQSAEQSKGMFKHPCKFIADINLLLANKASVFNDELELTDGRHFERDYIPTYIDHEYSGHLWKYRDVTARKQAGNALNDSEIRYRNLVENISDVLYEIDPQGVIRYISPTIEKILGYKAQDIIGKNFIHFVGVTDEFLMERLQNLAVNLALENEYQLLTKSGQPCWIRLSTKALFRDGEYAGGSGTLIDITERKLAEVKLKKSEEGLRKLSRAVEQSPVMTCITNLEGIIEYANPKTIELTGYTWEELIGQNPGILSSGETPAEEYRLMWQTISAGNEWKGEFHNRKKNGELYWVTAWISPILNSSGEISHYVSIEEDITERKRADEILHESEELYRSVLLASPDNITITDLDGHILMVSPAGLSMFGYESLEQLINRSLNDFLYPDDHEKAMVNINLMFTGVLGKPADYRAVRSDGAVMDIEVNGEFIRNSKGEPSRMIFVIRDITRRKRTEEKIREQNEKLNAIITAIPDLIIVSDQYGTALEFHSEVPSSYIPDGENKYSVNVKSVFDEEVVRLHLQHIDACIRNKSLETYEYSAKRNGMPCYYETRMVPVGDDKALVFVRDITVRKQSEAEIHNLNVTLALTVDERTAQLAETNRNLQQENTARIKAAAAMEEALDRLHKIADRLPGVVYQYRLRPDGSSCFPFASEGLKDIYLVNPEDVAEDATPVFNILHPDDVAEVTSSIMASAADLTLWRHEYRVKYDDGTERWLSGNAMPQREPDGSVLWHGFISDITARKHSEEQLHESEQRFSLFMDQLPVIVFIKDDEGRIIYANRTMDAALGASQWIGLLPQTLHDKDTTDRILYDDQLTFRSGYRKIEESFLNLDGRIHHYETQKFTIPQVDGRLLLGGIALDLTERLDAEEELKKLSTRLTLAASAGRIGVWDFDVLNNALIWDNRMFELYGIEKQDFGGAYDAWVAGVHPDDRQRGDSEIQAAITGEKEFDTEFRVVWPNGTVRHIKAQASVQRDQAGMALHLVGTNWDITDQVRAMAFEKELLQLSMSLTGIRGVEISEALNRAMKRIGSYLDADRVYLYEFHPDRSTMTNTREWCNEGIRPNLGTFSDIPYDFFPFPLEVLKQHEAIIVPSVGNLPESRRKEREMMELHGIKSVLVLPLLNEDQLIGFVGLNGEKREREFDSNEIGNLRVWSNMLAGLLNKQRNDLALEQTRKNYETFFNTIDDFLFVLNEDGTILHTNDTVLQRLGYLTGELMDESVLMVHPPERREEAGRIVGEMLAGTTDFCPVPLISKNGMLIPVETKVKRGYWDSKSVIFGVSKDVTKIKLSEEKFSTAFHSNSALMAISDFKGGAYVDVNETFLKTLGYLRDEVVGKTAGELGLFTDARIRSMLMERLQLHQPVRDVETQVRTKTGQLHTGLFSAELIFVGNDQCLLTVMVDITGRKQAEAEMIKARNEADKANRAKSEFISRMSHELRTPMNSILGFAQLMEMGELNPAHRKGVNHILTSGKHLLSLINEVLDISRIEAGRLTLSLEPVQVTGMMMEIIDVVSTESMKMHQTMEIVHSQAGLLFVKADRQRLRQVLLNLVTNAIKYNNEGGSVMLKTEATHNGPAGTSKIRISVIDSGPGINPDDIGKLFLPFERIGAEKTGIEGTGLGLALAKELTEAMGGKLGVESIQGTGSTFWIELPVVEDLRVNTAQTGMGTKPGIIKKGQAGTILYIEDNIPNAELVESIITSHRPFIRLITSMFGKSAVKFASECKPDLILLDLDLPDMDGSEVLANLREDPVTSAIPVVIVSADATAQKVELLMNAGARDYLAKPLDVISFLDVVDEWLDKAGETE